MSKLLIIGAGGVGRVATFKAAELLGETFSEITLASRTESKCRDIVKDIGKPLATATVDADNAAEVAALIRKTGADIVLNVALPYQDLSIMDGCLEAGAHYVDTANYEPPETAKFEYKWQWAYREKFEKAGLTALLGSGFDPGVTNVFCAWLAKHHFDRLEEVEILDANAGDHGYPFATNFNPEINIREVTAKGRYWEKDKGWLETDPLSQKQVFDFPAIGEKNAYLMYHEEMESLVLNLPHLKKISFWMTFSDAYLTHLKVLENVGMTSIEPVLYEGREIVPLQFLKALLPDPASLGPRTKGKTCIGCLASGIRDGQSKRLFLYNNCDHQECFRETGAQAVSYTTGVPAMIGAKMVATGKWRKPGVWNMEQFDPDPFMEDLNLFGLPWQHIEK